MNHTAQGEEGSEEEFTPAPARTPRRQSRRTTTQSASQTPRTARRTRRPKTSEAIEPPEVYEMPEQASRTGSPTKRPPRKRRTITTEKSRFSTASEVAPTLPASPDQSRISNSALTEITNATLNGKSSNIQTHELLISNKSPPRPLEKPMDIVIRSRAMPQAAPVEPTGPKSRIVLTYLVLTNFKSYAGRQEVGPFHSSFSSVVGPNGSGKSNVIDSLLFVFGFRASKMRQGKISALIHNSAIFPNLEFCEVEVHFQEVMDMVSLDVIVLNSN